MPDEGIGLLKRLGLGAREWLTIGFTAVSIIVWTVTLRHDTTDANRQIADLRERVTQLDARITKQEEFNGNTYQRADVVRVELAGIRERLTSIETYMRKIAQ